ncbi:hypothetical protein FACS1894113_3040 [Alphaproteobacteria bacterium]|nr:hypothetical protein FACS1894113_3040 [Alphaproteobacteria bacterium]
MKASGILVFVITLFCACWCVASDNINNLDAPLVQMDNPFDTIHRFTTETEHRSMIEAYLEKYRKIAAIYPSLTIGEDIISTYYEQGIPDTFYGFHHLGKLGRALIFGGKTFVYAVNDAFEFANVFFSEMRLLDYLAAGLDVGRALMSSISKYFDRKDLEISRALVSNFTISGLETRLQEIDFNICGALDSVLDIGKFIARSFGEQQSGTLSADDIAMLIRLKNLLSHFSKENKTQKWILGIGKALAITMCTVKDIFVVVKSRDYIISTWLTLISATLSSLYDSMESHFTKGPSATKYMLASEILYLCNYFMKKLLGIIDGSGTTV